MRLRLVPVVLITVALAGCGATPSASSGSRGPDDVAASNVDVATPEMVTVKRASKVEACPAPQVATGGLPKVSLPCLGGGRPVDLASLKGPLVINVFQAACVECIKEEPALAAFYRDHGKQYPVLGIDGLDTYPGVALKDAIKRGVTYPMVADPGGDALTGPLAIRGFPTFFFLHADGTLTQAVGGKTSEQEILDMVTDQFSAHPARGGNGSDAITIAALAGAVVVAGGGAYAIRRRRAAHRSEGAA